MRYKAVFFDAGETLVHAHPSFAELFAKVVSRAGHPVDAEGIAEAISQNAAGRLEKAAKDNELWSTDPGRSRAFWLGIYRELLRETGVPADEGLDVKLYEAFSDHANYSLFPDVEPVLEKLGSAGLILGVISNFEEWLEVLLEHLDIARYFSVKAISGIEGVEKPDLSLFRIALSRAGVEAGDAIYIGDNPRFDAEPAAAIGMHAVLLDRRGRFPDAKTTTVSSLDELPPMVGV